MQILLRFCLHYLLWTIAERSSVLEAEARRVQIVVDLPKSTLCQSKFLSIPFALLLMLAEHRVKCLSQLSVSKRPGRLFHLLNISLNKTWHIV